MEKRSAGSGREAMAWLLRGDEPTSKDATLDREIAQVLTKDKPARRRPPRKVARAAAKPVCGRMTISAFMATLPPNLKRHGETSASVKDVVKQIRTDLAAAVGTVLPAGTQLSITNKDYNSVNVRITGWPGQVFTDKYLEHLMDPSTKWSERYDSDNDNRLTPELNAALDAIEKIADRHNYREHDQHADYARVGYYLHVSASPVIESATAGAELESSKELQAKLGEAQKAAKALGPAATRSICGNKDISRVGTDCLDQLIEVAERAGGKPVEYDARRRGWYPVDPAKAHLGTVKLGKTTYEIVTKKDDDWALLGPRGGWSSLVRNAKRRDEWAHVGFGGGNQTVWYREGADGTFARI